MVKKPAIKINSAKTFAQALREYQLKKFTLNLENNNRGDDTCVVWVNRQPEMGTEKIFLNTHRNVCDANHMVKVHGDILIPKRERFEKQEIITLTEHGPVKVWRVKSATGFEFGLINDQIKAVKNSNSETDHPHTIIRREINQSAKHHLDNPTKLAYIVGCYREIQFVRTKSNHHFIFLGNSDEIYNWDSHYQKHLRFNDYRIIDLPPFPELDIFGKTMYFSNVLEFDQSIWVSYVPEDKYPSLVNVQWLHIDLAHQTIVHHAQPIIKLEQ